MNHAQFWGGAAAPYEIEQSLRFDGSSYLQRTVGSAPTDGKKYTISLWVKRGKIDANYRAMLGSKDSGGLNGIQLRFENNETIDWSDVTSSLVYQKTTNQVFRDPSAWYHIFVTYDSTNGTAADRARMFINNERVSSFANSTNPGLNVVNNWTDNGATQAFGRPGNLSVTYFDGYIAEAHSVDGQGLEPTAFGEYDDNGVWRPIQYTGTYGTNGFYLKFDPSATNGIGHDHSGNGNNFTASGFTTSGTGTDVMSDTPTTNWCTLNPLDKYNNSAVVAQNGNLEFAQGGAAWWAMRASFGLTSGKWYWEVKNISGLYQAPGLGNAAADLNGYFDEPNVWLYVNTGQLTVNGTTNSAASWGGNSHTTNDTIGVAFDADNGKLWFSKNGTWQGDASPNPATDTDPAVTGLTSGPYFPYFVQYQTTTEVNFGQRAFAYTPPTGFKALNTSNLPAPDIADGSDYFTTLAYSGTSTTDSKVIEDSQGNDWAPDFVWLKKRNSGANHMLYDRVRGASKSLRTNTTGAEVTGATNGDLTAFTSTGFTLDSGNDVNASGNTYVAWNWLAGGGSGSSNTDGTITSTVSVNPSAGFSIGTYTGNGTSGATIGHGLGVAPKMIILKSRSDSYGWIIGHDDVGWTKYLSFDINAASTGAFFNNTAPTSTVFSVNNDLLVNGSSKTYVAYCFAEVEGYSKFGSYIGNGSTDGPFVYCGFKPAFVMIKVTDQVTTSWMMRDDKRDTDNPNSAYLMPNSNSAEFTNLDFDFLSNGFKPRHTNGVENVSGKNYVFAAFASSPFGGSGVSPATAR